MEASDLSIPAKGTVIDTQAWERFMREYAPKCEYLEILKYTAANTGETKYAISYGLHAGARPPTPKELIIHALKIEGLI